MTLLPDDPRWGFARSAPVDDFSLRYVRRGAGPSAVLLHGWPGCWWDWHRVLALLEDDMDVVIPDLRGFGGSDRHERPPAEAYGADAQAASVLGLLDELGIDRAVVAGYDVGSRVAQALARLAPARVSALVLSPPFPSVGARPAAREIQGEFWYQHLHRLGLPETMLDGDPRAVRAYLAHFWSHWAAGRRPISDAELDAVAALYARPGAFTASVAWYRAGAGSTSLPDVPVHPPLPQPATVLWGDGDPLFPQAWSDRLQLDLAQADLRLLEDVAHFVPLEAPRSMAEAILAHR